MRNFINLPIYERKPACQDHPQFLRVIFSLEWPFVSLSWSRHVCMCDIIKLLEEANGHTHQNTGE